MKWSVELSELLSFAEANRGSEAPLLVRMLPFILNFLRISINANSGLYLVMLFAQPQSPESLAYLLPPHFQKPITARCLFLPVYLLWLNAVRTGVIMSSSYGLLIPVWSQLTLSHMTS